jgi:hypothetical protein
MTLTSAGPVTYRRQSRPFVWEGGAVLAYKEADGTFRSVTRQVLSDAEHGQGTSLRYFEVGPEPHRAGAQRAQRGRARSAKASRAWVTSLATQTMWRCAPLAFVTMPASRSCRRTLSEAGCERPVAC